MLGLILAMLVFILLAQVAGDAASFIDRKVAVHSAIVKALAREMNTVCG